MYNGASLGKFFSSHSQQRAFSPVQPNIVAVTTMNVLPSSPNATCSKSPKFLADNIREGGGGATVYDIPST